ncbi:Nucleotidyl transferase AbiEii toxin, Type IV TA system [Azotobacter vinelandii]|nr:Nucleotidyl transferase AbiEii toxin, Type IV TA system [Azotobacter vinelandii]
MDKAYADTVRLLLAVTPAVFDNDIFVMKGGTAINLFVQDMPRLSVDIDVVYIPWQVPREEALHAINGELAAIAGCVAPLGVQTRLIRSKDLGDTKLIVEDETSQVKVEVNVVFRGTVLPPERRSLSARTSDLFGVEFEAPLLEHFYLILIHIRRPRSSACSPVQRTAQSPRQCSATAPARSAPPPFSAVP